MEPRLHLKRSPHEVGLEPETARSVGQLLTGLKRAFLAGCSLASVGIVIIFELLFLINPKI